MFVLLTVVGKVSELGARASVTNVRGIRSHFASGDHSQTFFPRENKIMYGTIYVKMAQNAPRALKNSTLESEVGQSAKFASRSRVSVFSSRHCLINYRSG